MSGKEYKHQFKFVLIRYVPDFVKEEFFNAGLILYDMGNQKILGKIAERPAILKCIGNGDYKYFSEYANGLIESLQDISQNTDSSTPVKEMLEMAFKRYTTPESGLASFSNVKGGITNDLEKEFEHLYGKFIVEDAAKNIQEKEIKPKRDIAVMKVYEMLHGIRDRMKKYPEGSVFNHPLVEGGYKFEISFNGRDNLHLKVLSLRVIKNHAFELQNILSAITILSDLKKQHKNYTFGGLIYFAPRYNKRAQESEFYKLRDRFGKDGLDCVKTEEQELIKYFKNKKLFRPEDNI